MHNATPPNRASLFTVAGVTLIVGVLAAYAGFRPLLAPAAFFLVAGLTLSLPRKRHPLIAGLSISYVFGVATASLLLGSVFETRRSYVVMDDEARRHADTLAGLASFRARLLSSDPSHRAENEAHVNLLVADASSRHSELQALYRAELLRHSSFVVLSLFLAALFLAGIWLQHRTLRTLTEAHASPEGPCTPHSPTASPDEGLPTPRAGA